MKIKEVSCEQRRESELPLRFPVVSKKREREGEREREREGERVRLVSLGERRNEQTKARRSPRCLFFTAKKTKKKAPLLSLLLCNPAAELSEPLGEIRL